MFRLQARLRRVRFLRRRNGRVHGRVLAGGLPARHVPVPEREELHPAEPNLRWNKTVLVWRRRSLV